VRIIGGGDGEKHRIWALVTISFWLVGFFVYFRFPWWLRGRSILGLSSGIAASAIILFECCYALRRRSSWDRGVVGWVRRRCGPLRSFFDRQPTCIRLRQHIWLGLICVPLVYVHAGSRWGGAIPTILSLLFLASTLSGVLGLLLQQAIPRWLRLEIPDEVLYSQIPETLVAQLHESEFLVRATCGPLTLVPGPVAGEVAWHPAPFEILAAHRDGRGTGLLDHVPAEPVPGSGRLLEFYQDRIKPFLAELPPTSFLGATGRIALRFFLPVVGRRGSRPAAPSREDFWKLRGELDPALHGVIDALEGVCDVRRQLVHQARLHVLLHHWLVVHLPIALTLPILLVLHIFTAWRFGAFSFW
jgi:hypothetical protein